MNNSNAQVRMPDLRQQHAITHALLEMTTTRLNLNDDNCNYHHQDDFFRVSRDSGFTDRNTARGSLCLGVVSHPSVPRRVWKVTHTDVQRDPYILFARWIFENRIWEQSAHAPRIYDILESEYEQVALICMEELDEFEWEHEADYLRQDWGLANHAAFVENGKDPTKWIDRAAALDIDPSHVNRPLSTFLEMMVHTFEDAPVWWDIHKKNVMKRGEILVITDPFSAP